MNTYKRIPNDKAYQLLNFGAVILVCTSNGNDHYDIAPVAWHCPIDYDPSTRLLIVIDKSHKTFENINYTKQFAIALPHSSQLSLMKELGSCSGHNTDKIKQFNIETYPLEKSNCLAPINCIAYIECNVYNIIYDGEVAMVLGEAINVQVHEEAYTNRILTETEAGKTIQHLGGKTFSTLSNELLK